MNISPPGNMATTSRDFVKRTIYASLCMPRRRQLYSSSTRVFSIAMMLIGIALIVRTLAAGGGAIATGIVLGVLFILAGAARLYLQLRR